MVLPYKYNRLYNAIFLDKTQLFFRITFHLYICSIQYELSPRSWAFFSHSPPEKNQIFTIYIFIALFCRFGFTLVFPPILVYRYSIYTYEKSLLPSVFPPIG